MSEEKPRFTPRWINAEACPVCSELGMPAWSDDSTTARSCANCGFVQERLKLSAKTIAIGESSLIIDAPFKVLRDEDL